MSIDKCLNCTNPDCDGCAVDKHKEPQRSEKAMQNARERQLAYYHAHRETIRASRNAKYRNNEKYREDTKARARERYQNDPEYRERMKTKAIERQRSVKNERCS